MRPGNRFLGGAMLALPLIAITTEPMLAQDHAHAELVLLGGPVFTADPALGTRSALAVRDGLVLWVGDDDDAAAFVGPDTRVVRLDGRLVTPGINDAHLHFGSGGISLLEASLLGSTSLEEIERRVRAAVAEAGPGEWIRGRGWDHTRLSAGDLDPDGWPRREALDRAAPDNPVFLKRVDGHVAWLNAAALELLGITRESQGLPGGGIVKDRAGEPTGILLEDDVGRAEARLPPPTDAEAERGIRRAMEEAARTGVTSVTTSAGARDIRLYQELHSRGELDVRVYAWLPLASENIRALERIGAMAAFGDPWLRVGLLKGYIDGTLGSRTAWMLEPYADDPNSRGIARMAGEELRELVLAADRAGLQLAIHAIGDAANRELLDAIEHARAVNGARDARHRSEHAQILHPADIPRFAELGVIASMQPTHATSDMRWVEERIGEERARAGAYVWRSLLDAGATVAFGTDFVVEPMDPAEGLYSAVTRQSREEPGTPSGGWIPEQRLTIQEAIRLYTAVPAYAEFQEGVKGTLAPGMLADLVVWDRDLLSVPAGSILEAAPVLTVVGGRVVFEAF